MSSPALDPQPSALVFVFPGQGSQSLGMLAELGELHAGVRETFAEASEGADVDLWALSQGGPEAMLNRTEYTQPALLAAGVAVWRLWRKQGGATPSHLAGHSLGEYTALVAAGAISLRDAAHLVRIRGQAMQDAAPEGVGAMAAVLGAEDSVVEEVCREISGEHVVAPANYNSPGQIVIGGHVPAVDAALARLAERGVRKAVKLAVSVPSHTPLMREAAEPAGRSDQGVPLEPAVDSGGAERRCARTPVSPRSARRWCVSSTCRCAGPSACRRWPRRERRAWPNAGRARS